MELKAQQLVVDNLDLINIIIRKMNIRQNERDDVYGYLQEVLCKCANKFDETKDATFRTFASKCLTNAIKKIWRDGRNNIHQGNENVVSIDNEVNSYVYDISDKNNMDDDIISKVIKNDFYKSLKRMYYKEVFGLVLEGYKQLEIAEKLNINQSRVSYIINDIRKMFERNYCLSN